jgi:hypothetical protein
MGVDGLLNLVRTLRQGLRRLWDRLRGRDEPRPAI